MAGTPVTPAPIQTGSLGWLPACWGAVIRCKFFVRGIDRAPDPTAVVSFMPSWDLWGMVHSTGVEKKLKAVRGSNVSILYVACSVPILYNNTGNTGILETLK